MAFLLLFLMKIWMQLHIFSSTDASTCAETDSIQQCPFQILKDQVWKSESIQVVNTGLTLEQCLKQMSKFRWQEGVYCPQSAFCGLGLKFCESLDGSDYHVPGLEVCQLIVNIDGRSCEQIKEAMKAAHIIQRKFLSFIGSHYGFLFSCVTDSTASYTGVIRPDWDNLIVYLYINCMLLHFRSIGLDRYGQTVSGAQTLRT